MRWPLDNIRITQGFHTGHQANDLAATIGTPIKAPENGIIDGVGNNPNYLGGLYITMRGDSGHRYYMGHNKQNLKPKGTRVTEGEQIALSGDTAGWKPPGFGPHVHHQVWNPAGVLIDPSLYYKNATGDDMVRNVEVHYQKLKRLLRQLTGQDFSRERFEKEAVGEYFETMMDRFSNNKQADENTAFADLGRRVTDEKWLQNIQDLRTVLAKGQTVDPKEIESILKETSEAYEAAKKLKG